MRLVKAGLSAETVEAKIAASTGRFDVSTDALVALAKDEVTDRVIKAMITAPPASAVVPVPVKPTTTQRTTTRRYDVAMHRDTYAKCHGAELRVDGRGAKSTRCRGLDFDLTWNAITKVCNHYGFRGTIVFSTKSGHHRISTMASASA